MTIVITGANGFLGSALRRHWTACGHEVRDTGRYRLGVPSPCGIFTGAEVVVHAAHSFALDANEVNISATKAAFNAARSAAVRQQIYISSFSAHAGATSRYGITKFTLENFFLENGATVVRPGLVAGSGGMFARLVRPLRRWHVAPIVGPDVHNVAVIALADFVVAMTRLIERQETGEWNLFAPELISAREFVVASWRGCGIRGVVCPIHPGLAEWALSLVGAHGALDSVRGRPANAVPPHRSDLLRLVDAPLDAATAVANAAKGVPGE